VLVNWVIILDLSQHHMYPRKLYIDL